MPCFNWIYAKQDYVTKKVTFITKEEWKKNQTVTGFMNQKQTPQKQLKLPCGKCDACRLKKATEWGIRCAKEMQQHKTNWFITLTYDNEHLPSKVDDQQKIRATLRYKDFQDFMKRLRKWLRNEKVKYLACSEYGSQHGRPHYHMILFGGERLKEGIINERHLVLEQKIWGKGLVNIKKATFESATYIARYTTKKSYKTKKYMGMERERLHASQKIGNNWFISEKTKIISTDLIYTAKTGQKMAYSSIPRTWLNWANEEEAEKIREKRAKRIVAQEKRLRKMGIDAEERDKNAALRVKEYVKMLNQNRK